MADVTTDPGVPIDDAVEVALDAQAELGESPMWDAAAGRLLWVDILRRRIHRFDPTTGDNETMQISQTVGALSLRESGGLVLALEDGIYLLDEGATEPHLHAAVERDKPENRLNDGKCDRFGRFWAGSMCTLADELRPGRGALHQIDPDGAVRQRVDGVTISNGLDWSPDNGTMYYIDSPTRQIAAFDYDPGTGDISDRRVLAQLDVGGPDGMTVDAEGFLWVAVWGGAAVNRYTPTGELDRIIRIPTGGVTSVAFGGPDLQDLYVTTERFFRTEHELREQQYAGALFRYRSDVPGIPASKFAA